MFKLTRTPTYRVKIKVEIPNDKGGKDVETFDAIFARVGLARLQELREVKHPEVMNEVLVGFADVKDDDGKEVEFNEFTKAAMFEIPQAFDALVAGFWGTVFKAAKGN